MVDVECMSAYGRSLAPESAANFVLRYSFSARRQGFHQKIHYCVLDDSDPFTEHSGLAGG